MGAQAPAYVPFVAKSATKENLRIRLAPDRKEAWDQFLAKKKISQQSAVVALVEFVMGVDDRLASMMLGQLSPEHNGEMVEMLLKHFARSSELPIRAAILDGGSLTFEEDVGSTATRQDESSGSGSAAGAGRGRKDETKKR